MRKPIVYIASAYTKGDPAINAHFQCRMFDKLMGEGKVIPYCPLWSHFQHGVFPRPYQFWIEYDNAMIDSGVFDACLRLTVDGIPSMPEYNEARSSGADAEVKRFEAQGKPVFYKIDDLYQWIIARSQGDSL